MAMFSVNPHRIDSYRNMKFRVIWDSRPVPGLISISGLRRTTEDITHRHGDGPSHIMVSPGVTRFAPLVLRRGISHDTAFEDWANQVFNRSGDAAMSLKDFRKDVRIELLNLQGVVVRAYLVYRCWVAEYQALPELHAHDGCMALETLVLQHEGWERDTEVTEPTET